MCSKCIATEIRRRANIILKKTKCLIKQISHLIISYFPGPLRMCEYEKRIVNCDIRGFQCPAILCHINGYISHPPPNFRKIVNPSSPKSNIPTKIAVYCLTLKMEPLRSFETSVTTRLTKQRYIPEYSNNEDSRPNLSFDLLRYVTSVVERTVQMLSAQMCDSMQDGSLF